MIEKLRELLKNPHLNSRRDHIISDCPFCLKEGHFYVNVNKIFKKSAAGKYVPSWDCKKCSERGEAKKLFTRLGALSILDGGKFLGLQKIQSLSSRIIKPDIENHFLPEIKMPVKSYRVGADHWYLRERGITPAQAEKYGFYLSKSPRYKNYIIVQVWQQGKLVAFLSRYFEKDFAAVNKQRVLDGLSKLPKWKNSISEFSYMLNGIDEIKFGVEWVILVEGLFDKTNLERLIDADNIDFIGVCQKFGKKISNQQILLLKKRGIKNVILIEDPDAISDTKHNCSILNANFEKVLVGYNSEMDLGDSTIVQIQQIFSSLKTPLNFRTKIVRPKIKL